MDSGAYIIVFYLSRKRRIEVGKLGTILFQKGYYYYVGSAMKNLRKRVERHQSKEKKCRWHIDYLSIIAQPVYKILIPSDNKEECDISSLFSDNSNYNSPVKGFGSSDCNCISHLYCYNNHL